MNFDKWYFEFDETYGAATAKDGWNACKHEILRILKKDLHNLDLSTDLCDKRYIEKIEKL